MKQWFTIARISGRAAEEVLVLFARWSTSVVSTAQRAADAKLILSPMDFVERLRANGDGPPVCFFAEYVDAWSSGQIIDRFARPKSGNSLLQYSNNGLQLTCYPLPDNHALQLSLRSFLVEEQAKREEFPAEDWHFCRLLYEASLAWELESSNSVAAIVIVRRVVGGLVTDEEFLSSLESLPGWLMMSQP